MSHELDDVPMPNLARATVEERSLWLLKKLREMPGTVVEVDGEKLLRLDLGMPLGVLMRQLLPGMGKDQRDACMKWLKRAGYRDGRGSTHFIRLGDPPKEAPSGNLAAIRPPAADPYIADDNIDPAKLEEVGHRFLDAAATIRRLQSLKGATQPPAGSPRSALSVLFGYGTQAEG